MDEFEYDDIDWKVPIERSLLIRKDIDNASMRLYLILLSYAREKVIAFPSRETLAEDMGCSVRNIDNLKKKLKKVGLLDWYSKKNGKNKYNVYKLLQYKPIKQEEKIEKDVESVINVFKESYKNFCENYKNDLGYYVQTGWINNSNYYPTNGDIKNLKWYKKTYGKDSLKKLETTFRFLGDYLKDSIEFGEFYTNKGKELIPTISLFTKSKLQHDKITDFAFHLLELKEENNSAVFKENNKS